MVDTNTKYQQLIEKKQKIDKQLEKLLKHTVICTGCGYAKSFKDIDPKYLISRPYTSYDDAGTDFYYECNECNKERWNHLTKEQFQEILKIHGLTYEAWIKKYPKNYKHVSY